MFPEREKVHSDAVTFVRMTEYIIARILGLTPSNIFNTIELFEEFLNGSRDRPATHNRRRRRPN
jgi:hypothetical protein